MFPFWQANTTLQVIPRGCCSSSCQLLYRVLQILCYILLLHLYFHFSFYSHLYSMRSIYSHLYLMRSITSLLILSICVIQFPLFTKFRPTFVIQHVRTIAVHHLSLLFICVSRASQKTFLTTQNCSSVFLCSTN